MTTPLRRSERDKMPHFIIVGAQKSGTSSIHGVLAQHPQVFIPRGEIFFFDIDDIEQHPDFFVPTPQGWTFHDLEGNFPVYESWYRSFFADAPDGALIGEDTTTYLASRKAPERIARMLPDTKLIAILRDPVKRAYSHYWHRVTTSRATASFEQTLRHAGHSLLDKGKYDEQLERYFTHHSRDRVHIIIFDDFVADGQKVMDELCDFLEIDRMSLQGLNTHFNAARPPLWTSATLAKNRFLGGLVRKNYNGRIPNMPGYHPKSLMRRAHHSALSEKLNQALTAIWPKKRYPPMGPRTQAFLRRFYRPHVERLSQLAQRDLVKLWYGSD